MPGHEVQQFLGEINRTDLDLDDDLRHALSELAQGYGSVREAYGLRSEALKLLLERSDPDDPFALDALGRVSEEIPPGSEDEGNVGWSDRSRFGWYALQELYARSPDLAARVLKDRASQYSKESLERVLPMLREFYEAGVFGRTPPVSFAQLKNFLIGGEYFSPDYEVASIAVDFLVMVNRSAALGFFEESMDSSKERYSWSGPIVKKLVDLYMAYEWQWNDERKRIGVVLAEAVKKGWGGGYGIHKGARALRIYPHPDLRSAILEAAEHLQSFSDPPPKGYSRRSGTALYCDAYRREVEDGTRDDRFQAFHDLCIALDRLDKGSWQRR